MTAKQHVEVERRDLALTNLDKVLYPGGSVTKAHVIDYYIRISKWLLPHFERRPVTMLRFPDGVHGKAFYEKDAPKYTPAWVHTMEVPRQSGGKPIRYICIDDLPTLVWCANVASLELHPFLHRTSELDCPTSVVFDLDPGEGANLVTGAEVAFLLRSVLKKAGLEYFPKEGVSVICPTRSRPRWHSFRRCRRIYATKPWPYAHDTAFRLCFRTSEAQIERANSCPALTGTS